MFLFDLVKNGFVSLFKLLILVVEFASSFNKQIEFDVKLFEIFHNNLEIILN
jgi:hypothetical protein